MTWSDTPVRANHLQVSIPALAEHADAHDADHRQQGTSPGSRLLR